MGKHDDVKRAAIAAIITTHIIAIEEMAEQQIKHWLDKRRRCKKIKNTLSEGSNNAKELMPVYPSIQEKPINNEEILQPIPDNIKSALSPIIANAIQDGIIAHTGKELLVCVNIPNKSLAVWKGQPKLLHGYSSNAGKITKQGQFAHAQFPASLLAFQMASMITGMYFQNVISEQLSVINQKLDLLVDEVFDNDRATLKSIFNWLNDKRQMSSYTESDISHAESCMIDIDRIREKYRAKFNRINLTCGYIYGTNKHEVELWKKAVDNSRLIDILNIAYIAETEYLLANMLLYKMLDGSSQVATEARQQCINRHNPNFYLFYSDKYHSVKVELETHLKSLSGSAEIYKDTTKRICDSILIPLNDIERKFSEIGRELNPVLYLSVEDGECLGYYQPTEPFYLM